MKKEFNFSDEKSILGDFGWELIQRSNQKENVDWPRSYRNKKFGGQQIHLRVADVSEEIPGSRPKNWRYYKKKEWWHVWSALSLSPKGFYGNIIKTGHTASELFRHLKDFQKNIRVPKEEDRILTVAMLHKGCRVCGDGLVVPLEILWDDAAGFVTSVMGKGYCEHCCTPGKIGVARDEDLVNFILRHSGGTSE